MHVPRPTEGQPYGSPTRDGRQADVYARGREGATPERSPPARGDHECRSCRPPAHLGRQTRPAAARSWCCRTAESPGRRKMIQMMTDGSVIPHGAPAATSAAGDPHGAQLLGSTSRDIDRRTRCVTTDHFRGSRFRPPSAPAQRVLSVRAAESVGGRAGLLLSRWTCRVGQTPTAVELTSDCHRRPG